MLFDVAIDLSNIGSVHMELGDFATAAAFFERSLAHRQTLAAGDPGNMLATSRLTYMHSGLGHVHEKLNDFTQDQIPCMSGLGWQGVATCRPP